MTRTMAQSRNHGTAPMPTPKKFKTMQIETEVAELLQGLAKQDRRSNPRMIRWLVEQEISRRPTWAGANPQEKHTIVVRPYSLEEEVANQILTICIVSPDGNTYTDFGIPGLWDAYQKRLKELQELEQDAGARNQAAKDAAEQEWKPDPNQPNLHHPDCQCNACSQDQYPWLKKDN